MMGARTLLYLALAALLSSALAIFALNRNSAKDNLASASGEFLPGFAAQVKNAARLHIVSKDGAFDVTYTPERGWVLPGQGNYPADFNEVRHTLIGLAALEIIAPKTSRADWLHYIGLETPPKGNGVLIQVADAKGRQLASLIMGNMENLGDPNGTAGLFVRRTGDNQSWLARAVFVPHGAPSDWMLLHVLEIDAARLKDVTLAPAGGKAFTLSRAHMSDIDYTLSPPAGKVNPQLLNAVPTAVTNFSATDVRPAAQIDFSKAAHVTAHSFDGLIVNLDAVQIGADVWVQMNETAAPNAVPGIADEARALDARTAGWAYKVAPDKGRLLMVTEPMLQQAAQ